MQARYSGRRVEIPLSSTVEFGTSLLMVSFTDSWVPFSEPPSCPTRRAVRRLAAGASGRSSSLSARLLNRQSENQC